MAKAVGYAKYRTNHLKQITNRAKQIRKGHPSMKWTDAIKKASAERSKHPAPRSEKKAAKRVSGIRVTKTKKVTVSGLPTLTQTRNYYESEIRRTSAAIEKYKKDKTPVGKKALKIYRDHLRNLKKSLREQNSIIQRSI